MRNDNCKQVRHFVSPVILGLEESIELVVDCETCKVKLLDEFQHFLDFFENQAFFWCFKHSLASGQREMLIPTDVKLEKVVLEQIGRQEALG